MVKRAALFVALLSFGAGAEFNSGDRFVTEFSKTRFYQGETVNCNFVLYSVDDRLDVEVAKFPEFRGFWSENSALRQGQLLLLPDFRFPGLRKAIVGTYQLTAMVGGTDPKVTSMRLVLKNLAGSQDKVLLSEMPSLTVLPLPKPSPAEAPFFTGAVGQFHLRAESPVVRFFSKAPTAVRFSLSGGGNFAEINALPLTLPSGMTLVSQRASQSGSGAFQNKVFQIVVTVDSETTVDFPALRLAAFDPTLGRYEMLSTDPVRLEPVKRPPEVENKELLELGVAQSVWHASRRLEDVAWFWVLQGVLATVWVGLIGRSVLGYWRTRRASNPWVALRIRWNQLLTHENPDPNAWLEQADTLVFDTLAARAKVPFQTRRQAVAFARTWFPGETAAQVESLFRQLEESRFSPTPPAPPTKEELAKPLQRLRSTLFARPARRPKDQEPA